MFLPENFKFINEFSDFKNILMVDDFKSYTKNLNEISNHPDYNLISGLSFEFIIGVLLHKFGQLKQFGVIDYHPTYIGDPTNPDHGADGFGRAFVGKERRTRFAIVQIKYRSNVTSSISFGSLPKLVMDELVERDELNVSFFTNTIEQDEKLDHEQSSTYLAKKFINLFPDELQTRIKIRVISGKQLNRELDNFVIWEEIRKLSGLFGAE
jgi:hypothetical protein